MLAKMFIHVQDIDHAVKSTCPFAMDLKALYRRRTMRALALVTCTSLATSLIVFVQPWRQWQRFGKKALQRHTVTFPKSKEWRFHTLSASSLFFVPVCHVPGVSQDGTGQKPVELALFDLPRRADSALREALHPGTQNANIMHRQRPMASYERPTNPQGGLEAFLQRVAPDLDGARWWPWRVTPVTPKFLSEPKHSKRYFWPYWLLGRHETWL